MAHLLKYDSILGIAATPTSTVTDGGIKVDGDELQILAERDPKALPWADLGVDMVIESTGFFSSKEQGADAPRRRRPVRDRQRPRPPAPTPPSWSASTTTTFDPANHKVVSNASCTTNCFVPMIKVLDDAFGVEQGLMTTVHAYTGDQPLVDGPSTATSAEARAAAINIVPTLHRRRPGHAAWCWSR